ncbi:hypothetical protein CI105_04340 [Candidatus Izimaplasma bacterium ZiA1]|uniref:ribosome maturation factor RimP n=1 Tax=Candidatus Izimoplasma sp. ZiA1 TaxID=2024899 RepID=UPI000BAA376C|nr:hypothetical protein CI105_04340 [Candidatus Izimaplasma bacterium ZiA1]
MEKLIIKFKSIIEELGYYLYDVTYEKENNDYILRVMIENDSFIDIDDCVKVSRVISEELDVIDPFEDAYFLEVTSAGAEHELRTSDEIRRSIGKFVHIETLEQKLDGTILSFKDNIIELKTKNKRTHNINYIDVSFIRLAINI